MNTFKADLIKFFDFVLTKPAFGANGQYGTFSDVGWAGRRTSGVGNECAFSRNNFAELVLNKGLKKPRESDRRNNGVLGLL